MEHTINTEGLNQFLDQVVNQVLVRLDGDQQLAIEFFQLATKYVGFISTVTQMGPLAEELFDLRPEQAEGSPEVS